MVIGKPGPVRRAGEYIRSLKKKFTDQATAYVEEMWMKGQRVVFGSGGRVLEVLKPHEYIRVKIPNIPKRIREEEIEDFLNKKSKDIVFIKVLKQGEDTNQVWVKFSSSKAAKEFFDKYDGDFFGGIELKMQTMQNRKVTRGSDG